MRSQTGLENSTRHSARVECPKCGNGFSDDSEYYEIGRLALKWTMSQSRQGDAYRLESMLNG